jgi:hypothetical protein
MFALHTYLKSQKKTQYMIKTDRTKKLDSFFLDNQAWGALHKCWKGYTIAINKGEDEKMELYAHRIQELQHNLGLPITSFPNIEMSATRFLLELAQEDADNQEQKLSDEEYQTDRYEQERFTDRYSEDFRDDYDNVDRFTDDNAYREKFTD